MTYRLRDDVVLEYVSGVWVLVALRSAWGECPLAMQMAPLFARFWQGLRDGMEEEALLDAVSQERQMDRERIARHFAKFLEAAEEYRYLIQETAQ